MKALLIGAGNSRTLHLAPLGTEGVVREITTLDVDPLCKPDVWHDLNYGPMPFSDDCFDEIHAYEVLEHIGKQGDWRSFFREFEDYWRVLKPGGILVGSCPKLGSRWAWGDPGHTRVLQRETFVFLSQPEYTEQVGKTSLTDYRSIYSADFDLVHSDESGESYFFGLKAVKPSRIEIR